MYKKSITQWCGDALTITPRTIHHMIFPHTITSNNMLKVCIIQTGISKILCKHFYFFHFCDQQVIHYFFVLGYHTRINSDVGRTPMSFNIVLPTLRREANLAELTYHLVSEEQILRDQRQKQNRMAGIRARHPDCIPAPQ